MLQDKNKYMELLSKCSLSNLKIINLHFTIINIYYFISISTWSNIFIKHGIKIKKLYLKPISIFF